MNETLTIIAFRFMLAAHALVPQATTASAAPAQIRLHAYPREISLTTARDSQSVIVQVEYPDGITRDVTDKATWKIDREDRVTRNANRFTPKADGNAKLTIAFESHTVDV